jgi:hypothetical protein
MLYLRVSLPKIWMRLLVADTALDILRLHRLLQRGSLRHQADVSPGILANHGHSKDEKDLLHLHDDRSRRELQPDLCADLVLCSGTY